MSLINMLLASAQGGQRGKQQSSGQQGGSQPSMMSLLSKASQSGHSAIISGAMSLVSAYRSRKRNRQRAMKRAVMGVVLMGFGFWQLRRKGKSKSQSGGKRSSGRQQSGGQQSGSGGTEISF